MSSSRSLHDSVIDDDEELCPLCIEEFDLSDKNFKPCPCGYQICQFCYNNIKTHSEEGRCPNCRRVYDESTIQYRVPDVDEFKADLALKHRKAAAAKRKEAERREIEASSRKNLAGVRVVQKNLVYVIGLNPTIRDENQLLQTLRGEQYFGQYGDIEKIVVSKAKPGGNPNQGIGVYVTFATKADAATCIAAVDGSPNGDRVLRAQYGTTKYCSSFLRNEQCNNRNCTFLHETGNDSDSFSRQDLSSMNTLSSQRFHPNGHPSAAPSPAISFSQSTLSRPPPQPTQAGPSGTQGQRSLSGKEDAPGRILSSDSSALPSSASWANREALSHRPRRPSMAASRSSPSPKPNAEGQGKQQESQEPSQQQSTTPFPTHGPPTQTTSQTAPPPSIIALEKLLKAISSPEFRFQFSSSGLPADDLAFIDNHPSLIDPYGGVKRRAMREKAEQERARQEAEAKLLVQRNINDEENLESGSSQLGGEPEESHGASASTARNGRDHQTAIQPPSQQATASNSSIGSPASAGPQFQGLAANGRTLTPLQQQQLMLLKSGGGQQPGLIDLQANTPGALDQNTLPRAGSFQNQMPSTGNMPSHARQSSRFSFANDAPSKPSNSRPFGQQASLMQTSSPGSLPTQNAQHGLGGQYFVSGIQGPPPGLKTAGTPPVSGGGMFAQGHGFTSSMNNNLGLGSKQDGNADLMRELMRARGGASGAVQAHEPTKREFLFPFLQQHNTPPPLAPVSGLLSSLYGHQAGLYQDPVPQKQKKRGKKHRHANTSSGGGGVVDLADPSILQARMHQTGANATAGQGLYGSQGQADEDFPPLAPASKPNYEKQSPDIMRLPMRPTISSDSPVSSVRSGTPALPPGLPLPHAHPAAQFGNDTSRTSSPLPLKVLPNIAPPPGLSYPRSRQESIASTEQNQGSPVIRAKSRPISSAEISLGSPKSKSRSDQHDQQSTGLSGSDAIIAKPRASAKGKQKPLKLDMSLTMKNQESPTSQASTPNQVATAGISSSVTGSRPATPAMSSSRVSDSPALRQPRVLRVVDTPKSETPPASGITAPSISNIGTKQRSRKPSISSSRPETPADASSEYDQYTSASASRANSPPPSRIGSAPVRTMTKNQLKKDRKLKAKQAEAKQDEIITSSVPEEPIQAPIVGRKRKTKKPPKSVAETGPEASDADQKAPTKSKAEQQPKAEAPTPTPASPARPVSTSSSVPKPTVSENTAPSEPWQSNNTLEQLTLDSEANNVTVKDLFLERTAALPVLLGQLHQSGELDLNTHPLFNPPNLNQRVDMKCTADDYEMLKRPIELTEEDRKQLLHGQPVRISDGSDQLKYRCLITPSGCILRHLSPEEEDKYLELEKSLSLLLDNMQEYPSLVITEPDVTNRGGGLDALFATPEKFNIRWVDDETPRGGLGSKASDDSAILSHPSAPNFTNPIAPNVFSAMEADAARSHSWAITSNSDTVHATGPLRSATGNSVLGSHTGLEELMSMPDDELRSMIETSQRELETSRKEADAVDKKIAGLVKRNKKLIQQALLAAMESTSPVGIQDH